MGQGVTPKRERVSWLAYCRHSELEAAVRLGWMPIDLASHHSAYAVLAEWLCDCPPPNWRNETGTSEEARMGGDAGAPLRPEPRFERRVGHGSKTTTHGFGPGFAERGSRKATGTKVGQGRTCG
jgi:hypothetical protein